MNYYAIAIEAQRRAALKRIELLPTPPEGFYDPDTREQSWDNPFTGLRFCTYAFTPNGHYLLLRPYGAQIMAINDFRHEGGTYADLIPGYTLTEIKQLPVLGKDEKPDPN